MRKDVKQNNSQIKENEKLLKCYYISAKEIKDSILDRKDQSKLAAKYRKMGLTL